MKKVTAFFDRPVTMAHAFAGIVGVFLAILFMSNAEAAVFKQGSEYDVIRLSGNAIVTCNYYENGRHRTRHANVYCSSDFSSPANYSKFLQENSKAVKVKLVNTSNDDRKKTKKFYSEKGESKRFNLFVRSLFQRPLLVVGLNDISYQMILKDGSVEQEGSFEVNVDFSRRQCRSRYMHSSNSMDCTGYSICRRYFYESGCL